MRKFLLTLLTISVIYAAGCGVKNTEETTTVSTQTQEAVTVKTEEPTPVIITEGKDGWNNMREWVYGEEILFSNNPNNETTSRVQPFTFLLPDKERVGELNADINVAVNDNDIIRIYTVCVSDTSVYSTIHKDDHIDSYDNGTYIVDYDGFFPGGIEYTFINIENGYEVVITCDITYSATGAYDKINQTAYKEWADANFEHLKAQADLLAGK